MSFLGKATCIICNREIGLDRRKTADGWICWWCLMTCGYTPITPTRRKTLVEIRTNLAAKEATRYALREFHATKKIGNYIMFDEPHSQWLIPHSVLGKWFCHRVYNFDDIIRYELLEDSDSITKGGLGQAIAGGLLFGDIGATVGGTTGARITRSVTNRLWLKITVGDLKEPAIAINLIDTPTRKDSREYREADSVAHEILSALAVITNRAENQSRHASQQTNVAATFCYKCGNKLAAESRFCSRCGAELV